MEFQTTFETLIYKGFTSPLFFQIFDSNVLNYSIMIKEIGDEEPYYSTKILILSFIWAGLAALHKASPI